MKQLVIAFLALLALVLLNVLFGFTTSPVISLSATIFQGAIIAAEFSLVYITSVILMYLGTKEK